MVRRMLAAVLAAGLLWSVPPAAYADGEISGALRAVLDCAVQLDEAGLQRTEDAIAAADSHYAFSELYDIDGAYARYRQAPVAQIKPTGIVRDGKVDPAELFQTIRANNAAYLTDDGAHKAYMEPSDQALTDYCQIIAATVEHELAQSGLTTNYDDLTYNLSHLTVFLAQTLDNAAVTEDGCMIVSPVNLANMKIISGNPNADKITIAHETEHLLQRLSAPAMEAEGAERGYGYCLYFDGLPVNSMFHKWLFEAAAENLACAIYDCAPITYHARIRYLNSLTLALLPREDFAPYDIERLTQQQELDQVFETFHCKAETEQMELLHLLEAVNIILEDDEDFWTLYERDVLGRSATEAERAEIKAALNNGVCTTMTKLFYRSLAERMCAGPVPLSQAFALLGVFEAAMNGHLPYADVGDPAGTTPFLVNYLHIQNSFFDTLAEALDQPSDLIRSAYETYRDAADAAGQTVPGALSFLDGEKNDFLSRNFSDAVQPALSVWAAAGEYGATLS